MTKQKAGQPMAYKTVEELEEKVDSFFKSDDAFLINYKDGEEEKTFAVLIRGRRG